MCQTKTFQNRQQENSEASACRMCLDDRKPLIRICACSGSIKYVHYECITQWISQKVQEVQIEETKQIQIPTCQLCLNPYQIQLNFGEQQLNYECLWELVKSKDIFEWIYLLFVLFCFVVIPTIWWEGIMQLTSNQIHNIFSTILGCFVFPTYFLVKGVKKIMKQLNEVQRCFSQTLILTLFPEDELQ